MSLRIAEGALLNWLGRYLPLRGHLTAPALQSLLDVGSGPVGIGCLVASPFVGVDVAFPAPIAPALTPVGYAGGALPFVDGAFHTVVCLDTLEHVPPAGRAELVDELRRVAAAQVLLACPAGPVGAAADALVEVLLARTGQPVPAWAREHEAHGLPSPAEVEALTAPGADYRSEPLAMPGGLAALLLALADLVPEVAVFASKVVPRDPDALGAWLDAADFGLPLRAGRRLVRRAPRAPVYDAARPATFAAAVRCTACGAGHHLAGGELRCSGCGARVRAEGRVWRPDRPVPPPDAFTPTTFALEPDWLGSTAWIAPLQAFLRAFPDDAPCRLWLRVPPGRLTVEDALALLAPILSRLPADRIPELLLEDAPGAEPPGARVVRLGDGAASWSPARFAAAARREGGTP